MLRFFVVPLVLILLLTDLAGTARALDPAALLPLVEQQNVGAISAMGQDTIPILAQLYQSGDTARRTKIASIFYGLGWKSETAKNVLMSDIHTEDQALRLQVQWALGRVSNDDDVVRELLNNMRNDPNPLFRDKAACALADDQIHLTDKQKVKLYEGVIAALSDEKDDVRRIANLVLQIQTGQSINGIDAWKAWLEKYRTAVADE